MARRIASALVEPKEALASSGSMFWWVGCAWLGVRAKGKVWVRVWVRVWARVWARVWVRVWVWVWVRVWVWVWVWVWVRVSPSLHALKG